MEHQLLLKIHVSEEERAQIEKRFSEMDELVEAAQAIQLSPRLLGSATEEA